MFLPLLCAVFVPSLCLPLSCLVFPKVVLHLLSFSRVFLALSWITVLPWQATVLPQELVALRLLSCLLGAWHYRNHRDSNFFTAGEKAVLPPSVRYFRPGGTTAIARGTSAPMRAGGG